MTKKLLKVIHRLYNRPIVKFLAYALLILFIFSFYGVFSGEGSGKSIFDRMLSILTSEDTLSIFLAGAVSLFLARLLRACDSYLEESYKVEDDHHLIIHKYSGHEKEAVTPDANFCSHFGSPMTLSHVAKLRNKELNLKKKDRFSDEYKNILKAAEAYRNGTLSLPTVNVFTNTTGRTTLTFQDSDQLFSPPDFVIENAETLLSAHRSSTKKNSSTIRLNDFEYDRKTEHLTLVTQRTMYYHMLITNRCMDFQIGDDISIRSLYEYRSYVSRLRDSKLSNQIGINGLILTLDGYVLVEKRDRRKATWKNKFAQSISLALKEADLGLGKHPIIGSSPEDAENLFSQVIHKTVKSNFGLTKADFLGFSINDNFLGLARDLLEGGKPNLYFYVTANYTAAELKKKLEDIARSDGEKALKTDKLRSEYYLIPFDDFRIGFNYTASPNRRTVLRVFRRLRPRSSRMAQFREKSGHRLKTLFHPKYTRECGEALLVTLAYLEQCRHRIPALNGKEPDPHG